MGYKIEWEDEGMADDEDEVFATEAEAEVYALDQINNFHTGADVLHMSNPGDNPEDDEEDPAYKIVEID